MASLSYDENYVYLELEGVPFEASYHRVMVPIPSHIWEVIRHFPGVDLAFADKTDDELRHYVEQEVDERLKDYQEADEKAKGLVALCGSLAFGTADQPREQQIAEGMDYFTKLREHQRQIKQAIAELEQLNKWKKWDMTKPLEDYYRNLQPLDIYDIQLGHFSRLAWLHTVCALAWRHSLATGIDNDINRMSHALLAYLMPVI